MKRYSIYCTPEQTKKALELGAPIEVQEYISSTIHLPKDWFPICNYCFHIPTAEQMIGWLEERGIQITLHVNCFDEWDCMVYHTLMHSGLLFQSIWKKTRKEAILAAIDAALDYLINNKKQK